ncbi:G-type lectin S-receptor-like serine/threonine-protein kinase SD2-5 isoform X1 [Rhododendron vialii]|uniref:G-type lectin S-receptor-like serine/threonine-protein kinase SD2-5 isoform X1 n=1 Tax=Rhododendron vialii TaxID=182163 RepID=UPI00265E07B3|nr:G-type lectin S-receptor-like serine/threonine-protein kinase SD2-5 isoform X1 [Rhododendron vialii]
MATAGLMNSWVTILLLILLPLFSHFPCGTEAYYADFPSANLSVSWKNTPFNEQGSLDFADGSTLRPILLVYNVTQSYPPFGLGFFTNKTSISFSMPTSVFYLVVFMMTRVTVSDNNSNREYQFIPTMPPKVLWSANRDSPVGENATLDFTAEGDLVLRDEFGNLVWSTNTSTKYVARMEIGVTGNLMLLNGSNGMVWQSYDHPTDTWLPNQKINNGQRLTASNSSSNLSTGIYYLTVDKEDYIGIRAFVDSDPPEEYATLLDRSFHALGGPAFGNAYNAIRLHTDFAVFYFNFTASPTDFRFIVLEPNGHIILYFVDTSFPYTFAVTQRSDLLAAIIDSFGDCSYPAVCGSYGVCSGGGLCACPQDNTGTSNYFWPFEQGIGCAEITPLSCDHGSKYHTFVDLPNVTYFDFVPTLFATTIDECKEACLNNCSCKAALFRYDSDVSSGNCSLQSDELYSFMTSSEIFSSYASIKVQKVPSRNKLVSLSPVLVPPLVGGLLVVTFIGGMCYCYRKLKHTDNAGEESDDQVTQSLTKFSLEELKYCTQNFQTKLGEGGFGAVFEGVLHDGIKVAVKQLDSIVQGRKEFLAEVNTIGKVEHCHLVRLIGYCAEKSNRLLVYEHMFNGSLDKWIFNRDKERTLDWKTRQKIIYGVAKGLQYLHEECHKNIIHFDIKPQNILLDRDFNAKISDFGLARLIDGTHSLVLTSLKGTIGYLAPEMYRGSHISVKADIYSFGVVIVETICGRKNLGKSDQESMPLVEIVQMKTREDQLYDLIDDQDDDIWQHKEEVIKMMKIGIWCLQTHDRRPCMSTVVKVLEGSEGIDLITDHNR